MAKTNTRSIIVHLIYCVLAVFTLLFIAGFVFGPDQVGAVLAMIGNTIASAAGAVLIAVIVMVLLVFCVLQL